MFGYRPEAPLKVGDTVIRRFKPGKGKILDINKGKAQVCMHGKNKIWYPLYQLTRI